MIKMQSKGPKGINGWLLIPTINLIIFAILYAWGLFINLFAFFTTEGTQGSLFIVLSPLVLAILSIYSLYLEFKNKKQFPKWAIITFWTSAVLNSIYGMRFEQKYQIGLFFFALIWTLYFNASIRVKNTFVK